MAFQVIVSEEAAENLIDLWHGIAVFKYIAADKYLRLLNERISMLNEMPERGTPRNDLRKDLHMLVEDKYLIFYVVQDDIVTVVNVLHGSEDLMKHFN